MDLHYLDPMTLSMVVQLHLEDLRELEKSITGKGKHREGEVLDSIVAIEAYQTELSSNAQLLSDRAMCQSMAQAVVLDADAIRAFEAEETQTVRDRELACRLAGIQDPTATTPNLGIEMTGKMKALAIDAPEDGIIPPGHAESSAWAASRQPKNLQSIACVSCTEKHYRSNIATCPGCHHDYCGECLRSLFQASMADESLFPPKCCRLPIPIDVCRPFFTKQFIGEFLAKKIEFETPNRTYCSKQTCSAFVPPQAIKNGVATCIRCHTLTCTVCKKAAHANSDCPDDPAAKQLVELAKQEGWQKCYSCSRFVELQFGCNHITCRCSAQFCYLCGERWKTCRCDQWQEDRLYARANTIVNRDAGGRRLGANARANLVTRAAQNLVRNHQCQHTSWGSLSGRHQCEQCNDTLPNYIYECRQCRIMVCRRCRYNRLT
ncbi:hypothetical protein QBC47DRAFT_333427 [Echria macrotheca]|uniref:RBR-type E3 ubiquitin transferase n=1 Tax=Echria macrotheca TaxID=438768 RepID=A0AAJ0B1R7_9PEZI|nr:hypothetical protein QBC47DRAFT_333427 [Echria macrotheca]